MMSAFLVRFNANYLEKMRGYPLFSFWIPIALAKIYFFRVVPAGLAHYTFTHYLFSDWLKIADYTVIMSRTLWVMGNHVMFDRGA